MPEDEEPGRASWSDLRDRRMAEAGAREAYEAARPAFDLDARAGVDGGNDAENGRPAAVLMAVEDLESLQETLAVLTDPDAMAAIAEDRAGTGEWTTGQEMAAIMAARSGRGEA